MVRGVSRETPRTVVFSSKELQMAEEENVELTAEEAQDAQVEQDGISDEDLDRIADTAIATIQDILKHFDVGEVTIDEYEGDEGELILDITGDDLAVLIGRHGKTLDALQFLRGAVVELNVQKSERLEKLFLHTRTRSARNTLHERESSMRFGEEIHYKLRLTVFQRVKYNSIGFYEHFCLFLVF